ncbi:MAG: glycine--tRNA ligase, partial [Candidatus Micrarchaeota archaeon]|nr:glycine--tRNA ligase [Candidatus Micrarchaeota archaeon]
MPALNEKIMEIAVKRGFLIPAAEIYGSPAGFYDYGPAGAAIKRHVQELWRRIFIQQPGYHEIETGLVLPENVLKASGHATHFADPLTECGNCKQKWRADHLLEKQTLKSWAGKPPQELTEGLKANATKCPACGLSQLGPVGWFNLMFATHIGADISNIAYLRPETAQGIFLDFGRVYREHGAKLPIAIGQVGRSFRNEISPRQGLIRMREFTQMELEYFFNPKYSDIDGFAKVAGEKVRVLPPADGDATAPVQDISLSDALDRGYFPNQIMAMMVYRTQKFYQAAGIPRDKYHFKVMPKDETPHYSKGNV